MPATTGPHVWRNSQAWRRGDPSRERVEDAIYSDADVAGMVTSGPHSVLNAAARPDGALALRVVFRAELHDVDLSAPDFSATSAKSFHGGDLADEVAAILALALGTRFRSGGMMRTWGLDFRLDPLGEPIEFFHNRPYLPPPGSRGTVLPRARAAASLPDAAALLGRVVEVSAKRATAIVRAARQYQAALWVADGDPSQAWLHLVGAVEAAAGASATKTPHLDRVIRARPDLAAALDRVPDESRSEIARLLAPTVGAKAKFVEFLTRFLPKPPQPRPPEYAAIDWSELEPVFRTVYNHRSQALHAATPFPVPMCEPPEVFTGDFSGAISERPQGIATRAFGSTWRTEDAPILLSTFEHIARHALLRWALT